MAENNYNASYAASQEDTWRLFRIMAEFVEGFETLSSIGRFSDQLGRKKNTSITKWRSRLPASRHRTGTA
jgi:hypothetical protein